MLFINRVYPAPAPRMLDIVEQHDEVYLSKATAKVFANLYGFRELPFYDRHPCADYFRRALVQYFKATAETGYDAIIHNHTGALCGVFAERVLQSATRPYAHNNYLPLAMSAAKCATPIQLLRWLDRNRALQDVLLVTGDIADNAELRVTPVALCSDTICLTHLSKRIGDLRVLAATTLYDGKYSAGIWLESNDQLARDYDNNYQANVVTTVDRCLRRCGMERSDIDYVIPHNVNINTWKKLADKLSIAMERVFMTNLPRFAHCFGGDMFINLASLYERLEGGAPPVNCLAVSAGIGASFGAAIVQIVKNGQATVY